MLITSHGPVISPAIKGETRTLALRTVANEPSHQVRQQLMLMGARDWGEFREALGDWPFPSLNFAYADVDGNIGYQLAGLTPVRGKGHGVLPSPGWTGEYDWTGFVPFDDLPNAYNPATHWVASANNKIVDDDYPHFLSADYADGFRQQRIIDMLTEKEKLSVEDFERMQGDQLSLAARELLPYITQLQPKDELCRRAITFLKAWDYKMSADSSAAAIYEMFYLHLVRRALEEKLGSWSDFFLGKGIHPLRRNGMFFNVAHSWLMDKIRERPEWFAGTDAAQTGNGRGKSKTHSAGSGQAWQEVMEACLASAVAELAGTDGRRGVALALGEAAQADVEAPDRRGARARPRLQPRAGAGRRRFEHGLAVVVCAVPRVRGEQLHGELAPDHRPAGLQPQPGDAAVGAVGPSGEPALQRHDGDVEPGRVPPDALGPRGGGGAGARAAGAEPELAADCRR